MKRRNKEQKREQNVEIFVGEKRPQIRAPTTPPPSFQFDSGTDAVATPARTKRSVSAPSPPSSVSPPGEQPLERFGEDGVFFRTTGKTTVRTGPGSTEEEAGVLDKNAIVKASARRGDWVLLDDPGAEVGEGATPGFWVLRKNKHRAMLEELMSDEEEVRSVSADWRGVQSLIISGNRLAPSPFHSPAPAPGAAPQRRSQPSPPTVTVPAEPARPGDKASTFPCAVKTLVQCTVRTGPNGRAEIVHQLPPGVVLKAVDEKDEWIRVGFVPGMESPPPQGGTSRGKPPEVQEFWIRSKNRNGPMLAKTGEADWPGAEEVEDEEPEEPAVEAVSESAGETNTPAEDLEQPADVGIAPTPLPSPSEPPPGAQSKPPSASQAAPAPSIGSKWPQYFVVTNGPFHIFSKPGVGSTVIAAIPNGYVVKAVDSDEAWLKVSMVRASGAKEIGFFPTNNLRNLIQVALEEYRNAEAKWYEQ
uniref:SH3 domain-containing protein n=1 Tax=Rhizochromulina marina TaxID=1034831 RepID=A0A7S2WF63_9STRA|mmetsp:Transcript_22432/g.65211  ORF Transcript_22432/g.65211 Transcript_22432/m.65211 type:complete len:473 (+) Transcript_22432:1002-2420(+)